MTCWADRGPQPRDVRKIIPLLDHLEAQARPTRYLALDLCRSALETSMHTLLTERQYVHIQPFGLWGTFDDGIVWLRTLTAATETPVCIASLGSSFGNDFFEMAVERLKRWAEAMRGRDRLLLGMDALEERERVWRSYHDEEGRFEAFVRNGFRASNRVLGGEWFRDRDWELRGEMTDGQVVMHRFVMTAMRDVSISCGEGEGVEVLVKRGEEIACYEAFKYGLEIMGRQFERVGLTELGRWTGEGISICKSCCKWREGLA